MWGRSMKRVAWTIAALWAWPLGTLAARVGPTLKGSGARSCARAYSPASRSCAAFRTDPKLEKTSVKLYAGARCFVDRVVKSGRGLTSRALQG